MHGNFNNASCGARKLWSLLFLTLACGFLAGCPMRSGRQFLYGGTFNRIYFEHCEQIGEPSAYGRRRLINAYTALLYMDAEVAARSVRAVADVRPEYGVMPNKGVDGSVAFMAMHKLIPLHVEEGDWDTLLTMLKEQESLLLNTTADDAMLVNVVVALEGIQSHCPDKRSVSQLASLLEERWRGFSEERVPRRQELLDRLRKLIVPR